MEEINSIQFAVLSSQEIFSMAVCEVNRHTLNANKNGEDTDKSGKSPYNTLYDPRMGPMSRISCPTCGLMPKQCPGHFGYIKLNNRIIHPFFNRHVINFLKCFCISCSRIIVNPTIFSIFQISPENRIKYVIKLNGSLCIHCGKTQPNYTLNTLGVIIAAYKKVKVNVDVFEIYKMFDLISDMDLKVLGAKVHPRDLFIKYLPVLPPRSRAFIVNEGEICDDDLTLIYADIIKCNAKLELADAEEHERLSGVISFRIKTLFDNHSGKAKHNNKRKMKGIKERIVGKDGQIRGNLMGKRVDFSARTVIGPDPTLRVDEIAIPESFTSTATFPEYVNSININILQKLMNERRVNILERNGKRIYVQHFSKEQFLKKSKLVIGDIVHRHIRDGDIVLMNRQPTLHKGSMLAFNVKLRPGKTIRMNLAVTSTFNADFDGDEMNIHLPQSYQAVAELQELSSIRKNIIGSQTSQTLLNIIQDALLGVFLMTKEDDPIPRDMFFQMLMRCDNLPNLNSSLERIQEIYKEHGVSDTIPLYSGKTLFSLLLPETFCQTLITKRLHSDSETCIDRGVLYKGVITKVHLKKGHDSILTILHHDYSEDVCYHFANNVQFIANDFLQYRGFTISIKDCLIDDTVHDSIQKRVQENFLKTHVIEKTTSNPKVREAKVQLSLGNARDIGMKVAKESLKPGNNFINTVVSGSKGDYFNITQIMGLLGQQNIAGGRIEPHLKNGTRTLHYYKDTSTYESKGFIKNSFIKGLDLGEFWFHAMSGREGITDTSMKTAESGYIERKMVKIMEDVEVKNDQTVRNSNGQIVQMLYGGTGLACEQTRVKNGKSRLFDIDRMVGRLNIEYEYALKRGSN